MATGQLNFSEVNSYVNEFCSVAGRTANAAIQRALRNHLTKRRWNWKRPAQPVVEKLCPENVNYTVSTICY